MESQSNMTQVIVGKDVALATGTRAAMTAGQIGVFVDGSLTGQNTALTAGERFRIAYKDVNGTLIQSANISFDELTTKNAANYAAATEKLLYVGFNGTSGSVALTNSADYIIHMFSQDGTKVTGEHPHYKLVAATSSDATATETEIVDAIVANAVKNLEREQALAVDYYEVGKINAEAVTAVNAFDNAATVVNGSNTISVATNLEYNTGAGTAAVGDYIRLGTVGGGTTLTSQVYKITAINSLVITVDRPVTDASGTYAAGTADAEVIPVANIDSWGISFKGKALPYSTGLKHYEKVNFELTLSDAFDGTPQTVASEAKKGTGTYQEVAQKSDFLQGNRGEPYRVASYPVARVQNAVMGKTYDVVDIAFTNSNARAIDRQVLSFIGLKIYTEDESSSSVHTQLKTVFGIS